MATCDFIICGQKFTLSTEQVEEALKGAEPKSVQQYAVGVHNAWFPIKQALALSTGYPPNAFNSHLALHIFNKLGFAVHNTKEDGALPPEPGGKRNKVNSALRVKALELAVLLHAGGRPPASDVIGCAETFLGWVTETIV